MDIENQKNTSNGLKKLILSQFIILLVGTLFAWTNFLLEFIAWQNNKVCQTGCSVNIGQVFEVEQTQIVNPFLTPCFFGAIFFTIAFVLSAIMLKNIKNKVFHS